MEKVILTNIIVCILILSGTILVNASVKVDFTYDSQWPLSNYGGGICEHNGYIYHAQGAGDQIRVFTNSGSYSNSWTVGSNVFDLDCDGTYIYAIRNNPSNYIEKYTTSGISQTSWSTGTSNPSRILYAGGYIYIADSANIVKKFDTVGIYQTQWGSSGTGDGEFDNPQGLASDGTYIYVADKGNDRIQYFTTSGTYQGQFSICDSAEGIAYSDGYLYVASTSTNMFYQYTTSGSSVDSYGGSGSGDGQFNGCYDIDASGDYVYVLDFNNLRIQKFSGALSEFQVNNYLILLGIFPVSMIIFQNKRKSKFRV